MNRKLHWLSPAALMLTLLILSGCEDKDERKPDPVVDATPQQVADIEKVMKFKFPKSGKAVAPDMQGGGSEKLYYFKFDMDANEVDSMLASSMFKNRKLSTTVRSVGSSGGTKSWWVPGDAQKFRSDMVVIRPGMEENSILIDDTNGARVTVYMRYSTTQ